LPIIGSGTLGAQAPGEPLREILEVSERVPGFATAGDAGADRHFHVGDLLRSIRVDTVRDGTKITVRVTAGGGAVSYARFVELERHNMRAGFWRTVSEAFQRSRGKYIPI
jgi:hypothetical protein